MCCYCLSTQHLQPESKPKRSEEARLAPVLGDHAVEAIELDQERVRVFLHMLHVARQDVQQQLYLVLRTRSRSEYINSSASKR